MAPKKAESRPSQLSEEFVQDTSDDDDGSENDVASESALGPGDRGGEGAGEKPEPDEEEEEEEESSNLQKSDDDPGREQSDASSGTKKRPREPEPSSKTPQSSKRPKRR